MALLWPSPLLPKKRANVGSRCQMNLGIYVSMSFIKKGVFFVKYKEAGLCGWTCPNCCYEFGLEEDRVLPHNHVQRCECCDNIYLRDTFSYKNLGDSWEFYGVKRILPKSYYDNGNFIQIWKE